MLMSWKGFGVYNNYWKLGQILSNLSGDIQILNIFWTFAVTLTVSVSTPTSKIHKTFWFDYVSSNYLRSLKGS